ncbi:MAG TPA: dihydroneopterin aldolase [Gammaproteobacteria bacterium]|nr:dihydroneopterin aldolase [Gammaproteobacteria bacterium]
MDKIFIEGLEVETLIGIYPEEHKAKQPLVLDIALFTDTRKAASSEDIADTINYDALAEYLQQLASNGKFFLLEALAEHLTQAILQKYSVKGVRLRIHKPNAIGNALATAQGVGIEIERWC